MTAKCMDRWVDPTRDRSLSAQGPFMCGRRPAHPGVHAWDGYGACALWSRDGELFMAVSYVNRPGGERGLPGLLDDREGPAQAAGEG